MAEPAQVEALLLQLTSPDTQQIKQAEEAIKAFLKKIESVGALMTQLQHSAQPGVRQMAALLLRKKLFKHWPKLDAATQALVKQTLLQRAIEESVRVVRSSIVTVVAALASHEFKTNTWPELMAFITQTAASPDENQRETSMRILQLMGESLGTLLQPHFTSLQQLFVVALQDPQSLKVRTAAMRATCALVEFLEDSDLRQLQTMVPLMVEVLHQCVVNGAETEAAELLDVFSEIATNPFPILDQSLVGFIELLLQMMAHETLETGTRASAAYTIGEFLSRKPKAIGKKGLVAKIFATMLDIIAKDDRAMCGLISSILERDSSESAEEDSETPGHIAQQTLDTLALSVPAKYVNNVVFGQCRESMQSPDPARRKAGVLALGILSEGCQEIMCQNIKELLPPVYAAAQDADQRVRGAACFALGQFAEFLQPMVSEHYAEMLPIGIALLDDNTKEIKATALYVVDEITQSMESDEAMPYIETLVAKLVSVLQTSSPQLQKMCLDALGSIAVGAKDAFLPYVSAVAELIQPFSNIADPKLYFLRGAALECLGYLAVAIDQEPFRPYYAAAMQFAFASAALDDSELKEQVFVFFINLSSVYKEEFAPYLEQAVTIVLASLESDEGISLLDSDDALPEGLESDDEDDEENEDETILRHVSIRTDALNAKVRAISAVEELALNCGAAFEQYLPKFLEALASLTAHLHEDVRAAVAEALAGLVICSFEAAHPGSEDVQVWVKGDISKVLLTELNAVILNAVVKGLVEELLNDPEEVVVEKAFNALKVMSGRIGAAVTVDYMPMITEIIKQVLCKEHECQVGLEDDEEEGADGGSVLEAASELVGVLGKCYGDQFGFTFETLFPPLLAFASSIHADRDRAAVVGCFAEVLRELGPAALGYVERVFPVVIQGLTSENYVLRANCAFCLGILAEVSGQNLAAAYEQMLQALPPLFNTESNDAVVVDNAAAAVARMILACPNSVPLEGVLPVLLGAMPLKADFDESPVVFRCLNSLVAARSPVAMNLMPQVLEVYAKAFVEGAGVEEEDQNAIRETLRGLLGEFEAQMQSVVATLSPELQAALGAALQ